MIQTKNENNEKLKIESIKRSKKPIETKKENWIVIINAGNGGVVVIVYNEKLINESSSQISDQDNKL